MMKKPFAAYFATFIFTLNVCAGPLQAETNAPASLYDVVQASLYRSPSLKAANAHVLESQSSLKEAGYKNWPTLSVQSAVTRGDNPVYVFGSLLEQQQFTAANFNINTLNNPDPLTNYKNALVLGVPVFAAFQLQTNEKINRVGLDAANVYAEGTTQQLRYRAIETYVQAPLMRDKLAVLNERIASSKAEVESAKKLNARGLVLGSDYYAAQAVLSGLEMQKIQVAKQIEAVQEQLSILTGTFPVVLSTGSVVSETGYPLENADAYFSRASIKRPDAQIADQQSAVANMGYQQTTRSLWPVVDAYASLETNTEDFSSNPSNTMVGLRADFPIGDPTYYSRKGKAKAQWEAAKRAKEGVSDQARMDVAAALRAYEGAIASLPAANEMSSRAQESLELFRPLYREGRQSIIDVLRAEEAVVRAKSVVLETRGQMHTSFARLQLATGSLDDAVVLEISKRLEVR